MHQIVHELHTLLDKAGERPPYVLVGHSFGGALVRLYQSRYPADVVSLVLVDAAADNPWHKKPDKGLVRSSDLATGKPIPAVKTSDPLRDSEIPERFVTMIKEQVPQLMLTQTIRLATNCRQLTAYPPDEALSCVLCRERSRQPPDISVTRRRSALVRPSSSRPADPPHRRDVRKAHGLQGYAPGILPRRPPRGFSNLSLRGPQERLEADLSREAAAEMCAPG